MVQKRLAMGSLCLLTFACGAPAAPLATPEPATAPPPAREAATPVVDAGPPAKTGAQKRPLEIRNGCDTVASVFFGEDPKVADQGEKHALGVGATKPVPRRADGSQTVWLLDDAGAPLIKVNITRGMKQIEVGRSCRTLDAR